MEEGDELILKVGGDGTFITKKVSATVHTVMLSNAEKALQISMLAIVLGSEENEVKYQKYKLQELNPALTDPTVMEIRLSNYPSTP